MQPLVFTFMDLLLTLITDETCPDRIYVCANNSSYYNCIDSTVDTTIYSCPTGSYCLDGCGASCYTDVAECPKIPVTCTNSVTCLTDHSYVNCIAGIISGLEINCGPNEICDESLPSPCVIETTPKPFICPESGKLFPSDDCSYYYMCITAGQTVTPKKCPSGTKFDQTNGTCSSLAICTKAEPSCETGSWCFGSNFYLCSGPDDIPNALDAQPCDPGLTCDHTCGKIACKTSAYKEGVCPVDFTCTSSGRFAVPNDCTRYIQCTLVSGIYIKQEIFCPGTSKFDVSTGTCTNKNIICGLTAPTTIPPSATVSTTTSTTTASPVCTSSGRHLIPGTNCTRYDYCLLVFGVWQRGEYSCPGAGLFNPTTNICTLDPFICPF